MDMYEAKHDYTRERDDVLSFTKGEKFYITKKTTEKWWLAKKIEDDTYGYVPSVYLKQSTERIIGRLIPECRRDTEEHKIHLLALAEIHQKIKPLPAHVIGQAIGVELHSSDEEDEPRKLHIHAPQKQIKIPKTALRLEGLAKNKPQPPLPPQHKRSQSHRGYPVGATTMPSPPSPTLPTPPMSPNQFPSYRKHSWPQSPPSIETVGYYHPQLHQMPPPPMASPPPPDYDMEDDSKDRNDMPYHHKFNSSGRYSSLSSEESSDLSPTSPAGEEPFLIKPKPLPNPVKDSKEHKQLHRELRMSYRTGGPLPQKSELSQVNRERRLGEKKKEEENDKKSRRTSMEIKLLERQEKERMEEEKVQKIAQMKEQDAIAEERKPEFMKVRLKQTNSYPKS